MQLFYAPDVTVPEYTFDEQESRHILMVLRLNVGDRLAITDGRGCMYDAVISEAKPKKCSVSIIGCQEFYGKRSYGLTMAVAPTKNTDRFEWFLEKATEVGCDVFVPIICFNSERRVLKSERCAKIISSAVKQSLKAYHPAIEAVTEFRELIKRPFEGRKYIAHCREKKENILLKDSVKPGENNLILIGPEGDFSVEEINFALDNGFREVSLGDSRLRTETAALAAVMTVSLINQG